MSDNKNSVICAKCGVPLEEKRVQFTYLEHNVESDVPVCPVCGQVYLSEELVKSKVESVESLLEEK